MKVAKLKNAKDLETDLIKHVTLISDPDVKNKIELNIFKKEE